jgi:hypothetical protein
LCPPNPNEFEIAENACQKIRKQTNNATTEKDREALQDESTHQH